MIMLCAGSMGLTQMAGSSAASPPLGTGSVSIVATTASSETVKAAGATTGCCAPGLSSPDFDFSYSFSLSFFFSVLSPDLSLGAPQLLSCAEALRKLRAKAETAQTGLQ